MISTCKEYNLRYIIPLTDLEIDIINKQRMRFEDNSIVLCMQTAEVLSIARDKYKLSDMCEQDENIPSVKTCLLANIPDDFDNLDFERLERFYNKLSLGVCETKEQELEGNRLL